MYIDFIPYFTDFDVKALKGGGRMSQSEQSEQKKKKKKKDDESFLEIVFGEIFDFISFIFVDIFLNILLFIPRMIFRIFRFIFDWFLAPAERLEG